MQKECRSPGLKALNPGDRQLTKKIMKIYQQIYSYQSQRRFEFRDITEIVKEIVKKSKVKDGQVLIYSPHTTLAIKVNEKEKGIFSDFAKFAEKILPRKAYYCHNDLKIRTENIVCSVGATDCLNGDSHCLHLLMNTSENLIINKGELLLGTWQRIFAIELDDKRKRQVYIQVMGE